MVLFRTLWKSSLVVLTTVAVSSCLSPPNFPSTPSIEFKKLEVTRVVDNTGTYDNVAVTVSFKDGEGDLGLTEEQKTADSPYTRYLADGVTLNRNYYNYFITPFVETSPGQFEAVPLLDVRLPYDSTYPPLDPTNGKAAPLKGDLTFTTKIYADIDTPIKPGQNIRFEVSIMDRALHESNKITTSAYHVE